MPKPIKILILEDNDDFLEILSLTIDAQYPDASIDTVGSLKDCCTHLKNKLYDCIVSDLNLPDSRDLNTVEQILSHSQDTPLIVLTGSDSSIGVEAVKKGAYDYIEKSNYSSQKLLSSIKSSIEKYQSSLQEKEKTIVQQNGQKLESIGLLAAGIAHEINTPSQFVSDNIAFLEECFNSMKHLVEKISHFSENDSAEDLLKELQEHTNSDEFSFIYSEITPAITNATEGMERITEIVQSMKKFSHSGLNGKEPFDINEGIQTTIVISRNEWKYHSTIETDYSSEIPIIECFGNNLNQVILNLIINASHSISDNIKLGNIDTGLIKISTSLLEGQIIQIEVEDNGCGIDEKITEKIFDPFFSTKDVGVGTGQGLSISHNTICQEMGGSLTFKNNEDYGCCFTIKIPKDKN